jgi:chromosome partitioning protein
VRIIGRRRRDIEAPPEVPVEPDVDEPAVVIIDDRARVVDQKVESVPTEEPTDMPTEELRLDGPQDPAPSVTSPADPSPAAVESAAAEPAETRSTATSRGGEGREEGDEDSASSQIDEPTEAEAPPPPEVEGAPPLPAAHSKASDHDGLEMASEATSTSSVRRGRIPHDGPAGTLDISDGRSVSTFRPLPRVIAVANQKGGVGKTTTTVNLGAALAELGFRTLVVDLDPQGNATTGLGIDARNFEQSMYDVIMHDTPMDDCIEATSVRNLFVAPATIDLAGVEIELVPVFSRELRLRRAVETVLEDFDFVLIDCPPSLGLITVNGLAAASEVLVPIQCEYYALEGLGQLLRNVHLVASNLNDRLEVSAIVLTMYDARTRLAVDVAAEVRQHFGSKVCNIVIPRTVRLSEAPSFGQPITVFDPSSRGAVAYRELAKEVSNGAAQRVG